MATIDVYGNLVKSEILISSGDKAIDEMAINILKESAPFAPFNETMSNEYSVLEIVRDWNFSINQMQIVAFDYGEKKIGVAVGQTETNTSSPLQIIFNNNDQVNWNEISVLLDEWKPELIIIGKPLNMDGTDSEIMKKVEKFVKHLKTIYDAQYEYIDERLTTFEAKEILVENKSDIVDANAAKILIDNWFNKEL